MARQPRQVHIFLFRPTEQGYEYAVFQRSDAPYCWQGVRGGVEEGETEPESARRELREEAGVREQFPLYLLQSMSYLPLDVFSPEETEHWGRDVVVVPMFFFAMPYEGEIVLSEEHTAVEWLHYSEAHERIYYLDQKIALYELNLRLQRGNLADAV